MATTLTYSQLSLEWQPSDSNSKFFRLLLVIFLLAVVGGGLIISSIQIPEPARAVKVDVPDRIANFIAQRPPKPQPVIAPPPPPPKPRVVEPSKPSPEPVVSAKPRPERDNKPLTQSQQRARAVASQSGLLALASELNDLKDTQVVERQLRVQATSLAEDKLAASHELDAVVGDGLAAAEQIDQDQVLGQLAQTNIERQAPSELSAATEQARATADRASAAGGALSVADVGVVFNKNKSMLYALYERERRKNSGLKGKIVFQLTIAPSGKVVGAKVLLSELNNAALEARLLARIKLFSFAPRVGEAMVIEYPVEFVPS